MNSDFEIVYNYIVKCGIKWTNSDIKMPFVFDGCFRVFIEESTDGVKSIYKTYKYYPNTIPSDEYDVEIWDDNDDADDGFQFLVEKAKQAKFIKVIRK